MKIVCDFDGVVTDVSAEAAQVDATFCDAMRDHATDPAAAERALFSAREQLALQPYRYGWPQHGRIAAYASEDAFMANMGLAHALDALAAADSSSDAARTLQDLRAHQIASYHQLYDQSYQAMVEWTRQGHEQPVEADAIAALRQLRADGHHIVIVSNSSTARILDLLARADLPAVDHVSDPTAPFRVRGGAQKFVLAPERRGFFIGDYWIDTARPTFEAILRDERPQVAIGDVFSLDLALPMHLANTEAAFHGMHLFLRQRPYTPTWTREFIAAHTDPHCTLRTIASLAELPTLLARKEIL